MNERPKGMDFKKYKSIQKEENKNLNFYLKHGGKKQLKFQMLQGTKGVNFVVDTYKK